MCEGATQVASHLQGLLKELLDCLKAGRQEKQASSITLVAAQAAASVVVQRPGQAGRVLPTLLSVAGSLAASRTLPAASLQKTLKRVLWGLLTCLEPGLQSWKPKVYSSPLLLLAAL